MSFLPLFMHPIRMVRLCLVLLPVLTACTAYLPPPRSAPLEAPGSQHALLILVRQDSQRLYRDGAVVIVDPVDVFDGEGELLGRLTQHSWFAVKRPPGRQVVVAGGADARFCSSPGSTDVGVLELDLAAGKVYVARLARFSVPFSFDRHANLRCCYPNDGGGLLAARVQHTELIGVRPGGSEWLRAARILDHGTAYKAAPQGLRPPADYGPKLVALGTGRFRGGCVDRRRSRLEAFHGADSIPSRIPWRTAADASR